MPQGYRIDEERVRQLLAKGLTRSQVCARLGISKVSVFKIAKQMTLPPAARPRCENGL